MHVRATAGSLLALSLVAAPAAADGPLNPNDFTPIPGTVGEANAIAAGVDNARIYGVVGALKRNLIPYLNKSGDFVFMYEYNQVYGATTVVGECRGDESSAFNLISRCEKGRFVAHDIDTFAASAVVGGRFGPLSVFYGSAITATAAQVDPLGRFGYNHLIMGVAGTGIAFASPVLGNAGDPSNEIGDPQIDYVAGAGLDLRGTTFRAGFIGSTGLYTNFTQNDVKAFATAALTDELRELGYAAFGLDKLPIGPLLGSVYARKQDLASEATYARAPNPTREPERVNTVEFLTAHLEAFNLGEHFDVLSALAGTPDVLLHDARLRYHTAKVDPERFEYEDESLSVTAGLVQMPDIFYYGQSGGVRAQFEVSGQLQGPWELPMVFSLRMNDPETLSQFPYAQNAVALYYRLGTVPSKRGGTEE